MSLAALKNKLENLNGKYVFNFANEDDCAYLFEQYGGEQRMKTKFPETYKCFLKTKRDALRQLNDYSDSSGTESYGRVGHLEAKILPSISELDAADPLLAVNIPVNACLIDQTKLVNDAAPAEKWRHITLQVKIVDKLTNRKLYERSIDVKDTNHHLGNMPQINIRSSLIMGRPIIKTITVQGTDAENHLKIISSSSTEMIGDSTELYPIKNIKINDPAPKTNDHKTSNTIWMMYARTREGADYQDGDFSKNAFNDGKVRLLMPLSGEVVYDIPCKPIGLTKPDKGENLDRPRAAYDYKSQNFLYRKDIKDDMVLYEKMKDCFHPHDNGSSVPSVMEFDLKIPDGERSVFDWHDDVDGIANGDPKTVMLDASVTLRCKNHSNVLVDEQIMIQSATESDVKALNRKYYEYVVGTNTVYIPPITIYWGCYAKDVKVKLIDGIEKYVSEIESGDLLLDSRNVPVMVDEIVTGHDLSIYQIKTEDGHEIRVSGGHPMMCEGECVRASRLQPGDRLNMADGSLTFITSINFVAYDDTVYNFTFANEEDGVYLSANGFYAGDLNMQNKKQEVKEVEPTDADKLMMAETMIHNNELNERFLAAME